MRTVGAWIDKSRKLFRYLLGKSSDIRDLDRNDVLLGKIVLDIHRKKQEAEMGYVPIHQILPIHPIDREEAIETMKKRAASVAQHGADLKAQGRISREFLNQVLPSVSDIKVVELGDGRFVSFEGNGRLAALREGLGAETNLPIEVERYRFDAGTRNRLRRRIDKVRRQNGLGPITPGVPELTRPGAATNG
jgi:hypothetical protein